MTARMTRALIAMKANKDSGQGALEYIGILAVVVIVIGLVGAGFTAACGNIDGGVADLIDQVLGQ